MTLTNDIRNDFGYDATNEKQIIERANALSGKTIKDILATSPRCIERINIRNKGSIGNIVEAHWFGIPNNSCPEPDFKEAGIELKVIPLKQGRNDSLTVKERTKICSIDYCELHDESWPNSHAKRKLNKILFVFFIYDKEEPSSSRIISSNLWELDAYEIDTIRRDWQRVKGKVSTGRAHELSESISEILAASRTGRGGVDANGRQNDLVRQPITTHQSHALKRAFSLKSSYTNFYWKSLTERSRYESARESLGKDDYQTEILKRLHEFIGMTLSTLSSTFNVPLGGDKSAVANIIKRTIGLKDLSSHILEFEKYGISIKTIPARPYDDRPYEATSFPAFELLELITEDWETCTLNNQLQRILFVPVYRDDKSTSIHLRCIGKSFFWSPSEHELDKIVQEWQMYQNQIIDGKAKIRKVAWGSSFREVTSLSKESETEIIHIRPHGRDRNDRDMDHFGNSVVKQSFWLNKNFTQKLIQDNK